MFARRGRRGTSSRGRRPLRCLRQSRRRNPAARPARRTLRRGARAVGKDIFAINLVLDEIVLNVISYGYDDQAEHQIHVTLAL
jgi:anti-sigma regulatory factor (Ser/Thr protein kinase)